MPTHKKENKKNTENNKKPTYQKLPVERITPIREVSSPISKGDLVVITNGIYAGKTAEVYDQLNNDWVQVIIDDYLSVSLPNEYVEKQ